MSKPIIKIISGGQTGVDRAALDAAIEQGIAYGGWCPKGGWAEDYPTPPGLLTHYPQLQETLSPDPAQRTVCNVRDSSATLILIERQLLLRSPGTDLTDQTARELGKPILSVDLIEPKALLLMRNWVKYLGQEIILNIAGPRESEALGIYATAKTMIKKLLI